MRIEFDEVRTRAAGHWDRILADLAPGLRDAIDRAPRHVPCPHPSHDSRDGFRLFRDFTDTGGGICNTCGPQANGFAMLAWINNWTVKESFAAVAHWLGMDRDTAPVVAPREPKAKLRTPPPIDRRKRHKLNEIWSQSHPADSPLAEPLRSYLRNRGILPAVLPRALRLHPALPYFEARERGRGWRRLGAPPAMIARVCDAHGSPATLHRTYLTCDGRKCPLPNPKKLMPSGGTGLVSGGAIRLYPAECVLGVAEGIETALAVHCATGMAVWACVSDTLLQGVVVPDVVERLVIWADLDANGAGAGAADKLAERCRAEGRAVEVRFPAGSLSADCDGIDWADTWIAAGASAFPAEYRHRA